LKEASYNGGGNITFKGSLEKDTYFKRRIFQGEFILSKLPIHFFYSVSYHLITSIEILHSSLKYDREVACPSLSKS